MNTPDTFNYMVGGYVVFAVVMLGYIVSLVSRWNSLKGEKHSLDEIDTGSVNHPQS
jgi:hypothetical protein